MLNIELQLSVHAKKVFDSTLPRGVERGSKKHTGSRGSTSSIASGAERVKDNHFSPGGC